MDDIILFFVPGNTSRTSLICTNSDLLSLCPVEKIETHIPGHARSRQATNLYRIEQINFGVQSGMKGRWPHMLTAVVLPKRLGVVIRTSPLYSSVSRTSK